MRSRVPEPYRVEPDTPLRLDVAARLALGSCSALSLSKAREAAAAVMGDVAKGRNPAAERKEAAAAEWAKRGRGRLTLAMLFQDWPRLHLIHRRPRYAAEAVRALHRGFSKHLDRPAEDLDRAAVVHALDSLSRPPLPCARLGRKRRRNGSHKSPHKQHQLECNPGTAFFEVRLGCPNPQRSTQE